ncbi:MAG: tripartite tricarboxylate transporter TctB family protein [Marivita sp.]|uniref:tripartite tricarboxylate transporter TctB family protein n=1 Tax=Marivita sp. TaxID=2003365 RepID=UPI003EF242F5
MTPPDTSGARHASSWIVPLVILAFCAAAYYLTTTFDRVPPILKRGMQPADFPQLMIILLAIMALWLLIRDHAPAPEVLPAPVYISMALLVGFPVLALLDLFLALGVFGLLLTLFWGERRTWALVLVGVVVPTCVFLLFDQVFEIRFPRGLLTNLWYG